jgi:transcriptional regulator with XRE-family HTH domain
LLGINQQNWQRYETGVSEPDFEMLHRICVTLGATADWLLGMEGDRAAVAETAAAGYHVGAVAVAGDKDAVIADQARSLAALSAAVLALARERGGVV